MENTKSNTYLSFYLGKELFGANVSYILEVLKDEQVTEIPRSKDFIKGIINFRGEIVTVIDFYKKLNMPSENTTEKNIIIVLELFENEQSIKVGIVADKVRKVFEMADNELKSVPEFGKYFNPEYLTGVAKTNDGFVMLLDIEKVLNDEEVQMIIDVNNQENKL